MKNVKLLMFVLTMTILLNGCTHSESDISKYLNTGSKIDEVSQSVMPSLKDLADYENIEYTYTHKSVVFFESDSVVLVVEYEPKVYLAEKKRLETELTYLDDKVQSDFEKDRYYIPEASFSFNDYDFKVVSAKDMESTVYPKSFGMVATSDENRSIAYLYFYDTDLDYIGDDSETPMTDFVIDNFGYDFN